MKKLHLILLITFATLVVAGSVTFAILRSGEHKQERVNPAFRQYIQAYTCGIVSSGSAIRVRMTDDFADTAAIGIPLKESCFRFRPSVAGKTYWSDSRTLTFQPDEPLPRNESFRAEFFLSRIITVPDSLKSMHFSFTVMPQELSVTVENHRSYTELSLAKEYLTGILRTSDLSEDQKVEGVLKATQDGKELPVTWDHDSKTMTHRFRVDSIARTDSPGMVKIEWDGEAIGSAGEGVIETEIPVLGDFRVLETVCQSGSQNTIRVRFSDPLSATQNLDGLITAGKFHDLRYSVDHNILSVFLPESDDARIKLVLEPSIRNVNQQQLEKRVIEDLTVESIKPNIRFLGDGVIMPGSNGMMLPFEAVNLDAVDIKVVRVFEKNILYFLQTNDLGTNSELARMGRIVLKKTMPLKGVTDYGKWNRYSIDLGAIMKTEPGAIYSVILGFKKSYSTFPCVGNETSGKDNDMVWFEDPELESDKDWGYYSSYYDDDWANGGWRNYDWQERDNPCKPSYFFNKTISRNVIASDLGIIAKAGDDGFVHVFVTNLITSKPMGSVPVELYNLQLQVTGKATTNGEGMARIRVTGKPFILVARANGQSGYLKLQDGNSLSLSMFDVGGDPVQKGLKGYLYGDRGVWRPGDSIYLTFILEDKTKQLPPNHPVGFSLVNPSGQVMHRMVRTASLNGFYGFRTATSADAPTGNWIARVNVGGAEFQKFLKVETVKPNRLKIAFDFNAGYLIKDKIPPVTLKATWLTGSAAGNLNARVMLTLTKSATGFAAYPQYTFDNPTAGFAAENIGVFEGKLDAAGQVTITPKIHVTHVAPGALNAAFETTVFEEGGDFSVDRFTIPFFPYQTYAGLMIASAAKPGTVLTTDADHPVSLVNVSAAGEPVGSGRLKVEVYKLEWRWWWDNSSQGAAEYISTAYLRPVDTAMVRTQNGKAGYTFRVGYDDWGRYLIKVTDLASGHAAGKVVYADWPGYSRMPGGEKQAASMLTLTTDKKSYRPGETVTLTLPTSSDGRALVSLENGSGVITTFWHATEQGSTRITFKATEAMAPNCYAFVSLIQPHAQVKNDLPIRLYGVIPIFVDNPTSHLDPQVSMPASWTPGKEVTIGVKEKAGKPMTYTVAIVDEGLLDLTRFKTPDPWSVFNAREALGVKTWDLYDQVMGAFSGELQRILSIGGDEEGKIKGSLKANRFKPMVRFFGPVMLKKGQQNSHTFKMPDYIGSVRVMVVAGQEGSYGKSEKTAVVKKPLMVLGTLPRMVSPGEQVTLPVSVFAMEPSIRQVSVEVEANDYFSVTGGSRKSLSFRATGDQLAIFTLKVNEAAGIGKVRIIATSGNEKAEHTIEIDVRNPNPPVTNVSEKVIQPGGSWNAAIRPAGIPGTNKGMIEFSSIPPMNLDRRLSYLMQYPYGCLEQTISAAFPQLYLADLMELGESSKTEVRHNVTAAIQRLKSFQVTNGGLSYWPGSAYADDWVTNYAGHFMLEAQQQGYLLPVNLLAGWKEFQRQKALTWTFNSSYQNDALVQAYRLFTLALARAPELGAMNRLLETKDLPVAARWRLAAAYQLAGKAEAASGLISNASFTVAPYQESWYTYGSDLRDKAMIAEALCIMNMKTKAAPLIMDISKTMASGSWYSTQTTAYALLAVARFTAGSSGSGISASVAINNEQPEELKSSKPVVTKKMKAESGKTGTAKIVNSGKNVLYATMVLTGIPAFGDTTYASNNLKINVVYKTVQGQTMDPGRIAQGTSFIIETTVTNPGMRGVYRQMALSVLIPSGWEIINARMSAFAQSATTAAPYTYQDIRDDRVNTFFDLDPGQSKTFRVMAMAAYSGRFYRPVISCEAMYDQTINARIPGGWTEVWK